MTKHGQYSGLAYITYKWMWNWQLPLCHDKPGSEQRLDQRNWDLSSQGCGAIQDQFHEHWELSGHLYLDINSPFMCHELFSLLQLPMPSLPLLIESHFLVSIRPQSVFMLKLSFRTFGISFASFFCQEYLACFDVSVQPLMCMKLYACMHQEHVYKSTWCVK